MVAKALIRRYNKATESRRPLIAFTHKSDIPSYQYITICPAVSTTGKQPPTPLTKTMSYSDGML